MKKILFILSICFFVSLTMKAQEIMSKTEKVCSNYAGKESCRHQDYFLQADIINYGDMHPSYIFTLFVQHSEYDCMENDFVLIKGDAQDIYDLLVRIEDFSAKVLEDGVRKSYDDYTFTRWNWGILGKVVSVRKVGESEYHNFRNKHISKIKKKLVKYCKKHNVKINTL